MMYDEEYVVADIEATFKANLNGEITKINTEKGANVGDELYMDTLTDDDYIYEVIPESVLNHTGFFVLFGLVDTEPTEQNSNNFLDNTTVTFQIGAFDLGDEQRRILLTKLLRYRRAIKQVIMNNPDMFRGYATPVVASLKPDSLQLTSKRTILKIGVDITASITAN